MCLNGALCLLVDAVAAARPRTRSDRPPGSTISEKSRLAFEAATAVVVEALPFFQSPEREVSRTREGVPSHLSSARAATLVPSRAPYTPRASADRPATAAESLARSDSSADAAEPRFVNTASISASAFFLPSSSASSAALRLTSSLARPSLILPSASARARACCTRDSRSLLYFSVARRSASIAAAARARSCSCRRTPSSWSATSSAFLARAASCSPALRFLASSSWYCASCAFACASCCIVFRCSSHRTRSCSTLCCLAYASSSACLVLSSWAFVTSCCLASSMTCVVFRRCCCCCCLFVNGVVVVVVFVERWRF